MKYKSSKIIENIIFTDLLALDLLNYFLLIFNLKLTKNITLLVCILLGFGIVVLFLLNYKIQKTVNRIIAYFVEFLIALFSIIFCFSGLAKIKVIPNDSVGSLITCFVTIISIIIGALKYWDGKQQKWTFSILPNKNVYYKYGKAFITDITTDIKIQAKSNKDNSKLALIGFCTSHDASNVVNKGPNYYSQIYDPYINKFLYNIKCWHPYFRKSLKRNQNVISYNIGNLKGIKEEFKNKKKIWAVFVDNMGYIWGMPLTFKLQNKKSNNKMKHLKYLGKIFRLFVKHPKV